MLQETGLYFPEIITDKAASNLPAASFVNFRNVETVKAAPRKL